MTLVLALTASDGVVLVADGQAVGGSQGQATRSRAQKLGDLHGRIAYGCAGSAGLRQRVVARLEETITPEDCHASIAELRPKLLKAVNAVQHEAAAEQVQLGPWGSEPNCMEVLFGGVSGEGKPWIYEITREGADEIHEKAEAVGSGRHYAMYALMSAEHYGLRERGLAQVRVVAYRAVDDAIRTDAQALGPPISLCVVTRESARTLEGDELAAVEQAVIAWQGHERDVFGLIGDDGGQTGEPPFRAERGDSTGIDPPPANRPESNCGRSPARAKSDHRDA
jgi:20S proteasome alpha/beta subunit